MPGVAFAILNASNALSRATTISASCSFVASAFTTNAFASSITALKSAAPSFASSYFGSIVAILSARAL